MSPAAGYGVHFRALPGARLYAALENGSIDLWPGPGQARAGRPYAGGSAYLSQINLNLYHRAGTPVPRIPTIWPARR